MLHESMRGAAEVARRLRALVGREVIVSADGGTDMRGELRDIELTRDWLIVYVGDASVSLDAEDASLAAGPGSGPGVAVGPLTVVAP